MRLIDADALKADYGMKDDCADCEKELQGTVRACEYEYVYRKMDFCGWIDDAPTIELPERKKGHWIVNVENENTISGSCSACGWQAHLYEDDVVGMNFCPNCGSYNGGEK